MSSPVAGLIGFEKDMINSNQSFVRFLKLHKVRSIALTDESSDRAITPVEII